MAGNFAPRHHSPAPGISMSNTYLDKAIEAVPRFAERISLFTKKLRLAVSRQYSLVLRRAKRQSRAGCPTSKHAIF